MNINNYIIVKNKSNNSLAKTDSWISISSLDSLSTKDIIELDHIYIIINYDSLLYKDKYLAFSSYNKCKKHIEKKYSKMRLSFGINDEKYIKEECVLHYNNCEKMLFNINDIPDKISIIIIQYPNTDIKYFYIDNDEINTYIDDVKEYYKDGIIQYFNGNNNNNKFTCEMINHKINSYSNMIINEISQNIVNGLNSYIIIQNIHVI